MNQNEILQELNIRNEILMELNTRLCEVFRAIASGHYDSSCIETLFELTQDTIYPRYITELAENFGLMLMQVEAREMQAQKLIQELEQTRLEFQRYTHQLEQRIAEKTDDLKRANEELLYLSLIDGLTGIANRRHFDQYLDSEWKRLARQRAPLSLILIDIDHFKNYNDSLGHIQGDECLIRVAATIKACAQRTTDLVARYGGEEFAVILPDTDLTGARHCAETMRQAVADLAIPHPASTTCSFVTISLGVARIYPQHEIPDTSLIALSDQSLYQAKTQGRNRVVVHSSSNTER